MQKGVMKMGNDKKKSRKFKVIIILAVRKGEVLLDL